MEKWENVFWIFCLETVAIKSWATSLAALIIYIHQIDGRWFGSQNNGITLKEHTRMNAGYAQMDPSSPNRFGIDELCPHLLRQTQSPTWLCWWCWSPSAADWSLPVCCPQWECRLLTGCGHRSAGCRTCAQRADLAHHSSYTGQQTSCAECIKY